MAIGQTKEQVRDNLVKLINEHGGDYGLSNAASAPSPDKGHAALTLETEGTVHHVSTD